MNSSPPNDMAANVHSSHRTALVPQRGVLPRPMDKNLQNRFTAVLLGLLTVAAIVYAVINFQKEREAQIPDDGVWWVENNGALAADRVATDGPGDKAGIKQNDRLVAIGQRPVTDDATRMRLLFRVGVWSKATYSLVRNSVPVDADVVLVPTELSLNTWLRLIALIYLSIGLYVLLRRWTAPGSFHFYIFCLASFVLYAFHYTGKFNGFDWTIYWGNIAANLLQPALFLHFVLTFPEKRKFVREHRWVIPAIYLPGLVLLGPGSGRTTECLSAGQREA